MSNKRILLTGGGTAGHVIVNLALIPEFRRDGWSIDYIGSKTGIERKLIEALDGVTYHPISTGKLRRYMSTENLKDPFKVLKGTFEAWRIIGKCKPDVLFSKGGFVSVPAVLAAKLRGVPAIIHESDFTPGLANKIAIPFAKKVLTTFPETVSYVPKKKAEYVGAVIRDELFQGDRDKGLQMTGLTRKKPVLLVMGGSGGSKRINDTVRASLDRLLPVFQIIHICGRGKADPAYNQQGYVQFEYINEDLKDIFAASDFVISRAGANAIFEFLALNIPMLLIPLSREASRGDQIVNAKSFAEKKYARVLEEEAMTADSLVEEIFRLQEVAPVMIDHMKQYKSEKARDRVIKLIKEAAK
ncbi:MAG TPA: undecaprenyldiphospho-muramoylpentapeptide beta-N-acetylglucosaminyltransferase [Bacillota bacterium]|nr:undecaprenyldiphospho-muramoylpentapeptide beta-N-acetylglucosaminyltransferase [Bacillota bacterium]